MTCKDDTRTVWIIAGEASGDMYGARLAKALKELCPGKITVAGMGGPAMREAGVEILADSSELGVVGLLEVFKNIGVFVKTFLKLDRLAAKVRPDAVILIDYPGFNLRFARRLWKKNITVIWYVSPQVWAWGKGRIPKLAKYCKKMLVIFPFEIETYAGTGLDVEFVGHPLLDMMRERFDPGAVRDPNKFLILPGSRSHELRKLLWPMLETIAELRRRHPELTFAMSAARSSLREVISAIIGDFAKTQPGELPGIEIVCGDNIRLLQESGTALCKSGTCTTECAIAGLPIVAVYKLNPLTFIAARCLIKLFRGFFTITNIISNKMVYEELLQKEVNREMLTPAIERILPGGPRRPQVEADLAAIPELLSGGKSNASRNAAVAVLRTIGVSFSSE